MDYVKNLNLNFFILIYKRYNRKNTNKDKISWRRKNVCSVTVHA